MKGRASLTLVIAALGTGALLYQVAYSVEAMQSELDGLGQRIRTDREAIRVLQAEWSYLNQPQRLSELSERHLGMKPADASRIVDPRSLPLRAAPAGPMIATPRPKTKSDRQLADFRPSVKPRPRRLEGPARGIDPGGTLVASITRSARRTFEDVTTELIRELRR